MQHRIEKKLPMFCIPQKIQCPINRKSNSMGYFEINENKIDNCKHKNLNSTAGNPSLCEYVHHMWALQKENLSSPNSIQFLPCMHFATNSTHPNQPQTSKEYCFATNFPDK